MIVHHFVRAAALSMAFLCVGLALAQEGPESVLRGTKEFRRSVLVSGLAGPWEVTWGPDNMLWVTERTGKRITRIDPATGEKHVAITIDEVSAPGAQDGLLGMALIPDCCGHRGSNYVYAAYSYVDPSPGANHWFPTPRVRITISTARSCASPMTRRTATLSNRVDVIAGLPIGNDHVSGRLKIGPDRQARTLRSAMRATTSWPISACPSEAQRLPTQDELNRKRLRAYMGKSLRLNLDGSIPKDNPKLDWRGQPRLHLRSPQHAGHRLRSGRHALRVRAWTQDR